MSANQVVEKLNQLRVEELNRVIQQERAQFRLVLNIFWGVRDPLGLHLKVWKMGWSLRVSTGSVKGNPSNFHNLCQKN